MNAGKISLGVMAGVAAGTLIGILLAPDKGADSRKKIVKKSDDYLSSIRDKFEEFLASIKDEFAEARARGAELLHEGADHIEHAEIAEKKAKPAKKED